MTMKRSMLAMLGLKRFRTAAVVISGIELAEKIKKEQFKIGKLGGTTARMPETWRSLACVTETSFNQRGKPDRLSLLFRICTRTPFALPIWKR